MCTLLVLYITVSEAKNLIVEKSVTSLSILDELQCWKNTTVSNKRPLVVIVYFILPVIPVIKDYKVNFHTLKESVLSLVFNSSGIKKTYC